MKNEFEPYLQDIMNIAREAGQIILTAERDEGMTDAKEGHANFVTKYDRQVQNFLYKKLGELLPEAAFIGEEDEVPAKPGADQKGAGQDDASRTDNGQKDADPLKKGLTFIIDPIDGTTNFIKDYQASAVSIGLLKDGEPYIGVVLDPYKNELYYAQKGCGAYVTQGYQPGAASRPIHVSDKPLEEGLFIFGTAPYYAELNRSVYKMASDLGKIAMDMRRSGSAAIDLCAVASGRVELFFEMTLCPWDYAAGGLILTEAGGFISNNLGHTAPGYDKKQAIFAGNAAVDKTLADFPMDYENLTKMATALCQAAIDVDELAAGAIEEDENDNGASELQQNKLQQDAACAMMQTTMLANLAALIYDELPLINWAGFYLYDSGSNSLKLGPFQGRPACTEIALGRGVCGTAAAERRSVRVENVHEFPGHIACDAASASELVIPVVIDGELYGVLDIDSPVIGRFTERDERELVKMLEKLF